MLALNSLRVASRCRPASAPLHSCSSVAISYGIIKRQAHRSVRHSAAAQRGAIVQCGASAQRMGDKRKMVKIGTHSGSFHCDEALGCYLLKQTKQFGDGEVTRRCSARFATGGAAAVCTFPALDTSLSLAACCTRC